MPNAIKEASEHLRREDVYLLSSSVRYSGSPSSHTCEKCHNVFAAESVLFAVFVGSCSENVPCKKVLLDSGASAAYASSGVMLVRVIGSPRNKRSIVLFTCLVYPR